MSNIMSPGASPGVTAKHAGVRRVNNLPLFIVVGIMFFILNGGVSDGIEKTAKILMPLPLKR